uniref:Uncharacterized protein n=2 Tax=Vibrio TaxID=662 RepID=A0A0H3ZJZ5_9VIBR|nr:hypothetical protein [Vibrio tasmaniensis]AKN37176.1 hypothetical protein [Vibrio genomosp. F6]
MLTAHEIIWFSSQIHLSRWESFLLPYSISDSLQIMSMLKSGI